MARCDWRPYYAVAWDGPPPLQMLFLKRHHALQMLTYCQVYCRGWDGPKPIGILAVVGKTAKVQQQLWKAAT